MNNFSVNDKFWFYAYSLLSLLVSDFQFDWSAFWLPPLSMHCFPRLLACQLNFLLHYLTWKVYAVTCPLTSLPSTKICYSRLRAALLGNLALQIPSTRLWYNARFTLLTCSARLCLWLLPTPSTDQPLQVTSSPWLAGSQTDTLGIYDALPAGL